MASRLFFLGRTGLLDGLGEVLSSIFASGLDRSVSSFHGSVVSMAVEVGSILVLSKLRIGFQVRMSFVYLPHKHNDRIGFELTIMDFILMSNNIEISEERKIVTELGVELPTYPSRDQV
ncbi:hypothetical protein YC2023_058564 [Brassica napus]